MALIHTLDWKEKDTHRIHDTVECTYSTFTQAGVPILQIDTYGKSDRANPTSISQSLQLNRQSALQLQDLIQQTFGE